MDPKTPMTNIPNQQESRGDHPDTTVMKHVPGRIDREHPSGGEMSHVVRGILMRIRIPWLLQH